jgi:hypothetical protein
MNWRNGMFQGKKKLQKDATKDSRYPISALTGIFILILQFTWFDDFFRFLNSSLENGNVTHPTLCTISAAVIITVFVFLTHKKVHFTKVDFHIVDLFALSLGTFYFLIKLSFWDNMFDTVYYELLVQNNAFVNHAASSDLFFSDKSYLYGLGDRVFYYFRMLLGYRLSTLVNYLIYIVSYYQIKEILNYFSNKYGLDLKNKGKRLSWKGSVIPALSAMILLCEYFVAGMYMIKADLFIVPLLLECIRLIFCKNKLNVYDFLYTSIIVGLSFAIKLTDLFSLLAILPMGLILHRKDINIKTIAAAILPFTAIVSIFIIYTWRAVGNPVYPYYNWIFKGPYATTSKYTWDDRWGPQSLLETIFWPFINFANPLYRYGEIARCSGRLAIGYLSGIGVFAVGLFSKNIRKIVPLALTFLLTVLIWSATAGYCRYAIGIEIFSGVFLAVLVFYLVHLYQQGNKRRFRWSAMFLVVLFCLQFSYAQGIITYMNLDWKGNHQSLFVAASNNKLDEFSKEYQENASLLFNDRGNPVGENAGQIKEELKKVKVWVDAGNTLYPTLFKPNAPIYVTNPFFNKSQQQDALNNLLNKYDDGIYGFEDSAYGAGYALDSFKQKGLVVEKTFTFQTDFLPKDEKITMYKLTTIDNMYKMKIADGSVKPMVNNYISLNNTHAKQLFDFYNVGLSSPDANGIWTVEQNVTVPLYLSSVADKSILRLTASSINEQVADISIGGQDVGTYTVNGSLKTIDIPFTKSMLSHDNIMILKISLPGATKSPADLGISNDVRTLGLDLISLEVIPN